MHVIGDSNKWSEVAALTPADAAWPTELARCLGSHAPAHITAIGDTALMLGHPLAFFCSVKCPGKLITRTFDLATELRRAGVTVIGGFHTPIEQECLRLLLRGSQPIVVCPARSIDAMRLPATWRTALDGGRLLLLSSFPASQRRVTADLALVRNRFVAALADRVFVAYAASGGKTEAFCRDVLTWGKPLLTFDTPANANLLALGAGVFGELERRESGSEGPTPSSCHSH
jgi:predicted Rossmann fold nucleotide-binding protein DprA/Smf involved in DNA uptake